MFYEILFPTSISIKSTSIIEFDTKITKTKNGKEQRFSNREEARTVYNIINGVKTKEELEKIIELFRIVKGRSAGFRFKDWFDFSVKNQIIAVGDGINKQFQLIKSYNLEINDKNKVYIRKITKPVKQTVQVFLNSVEANEIVSVNFENGIIEFASAPVENDLIEASFEFDVPVRFDNDTLELAMNSVNNGEIKNIKLIEILE